MNQENPNNSKWKFFIPFYGLYVISKSSLSSKGKWYAINAVISLVVLGIIIPKGSGNTSSSESKVYKPNSFYEQATAIQQSGTTILIEFAVKEAAKSGFETDPADGKLNVVFRWHGAGVPEGTTASISKEITQDMYSCSVFCKAKVTLDVPNAYMGASWRDATLEFIPNSTKQGFKTMKQEMQLGN